MTSDASLQTISGARGPLPVGKIAIIASRYNASICDALVAGAVETLLASSIARENVLVIRVPGAWELTHGALLALEQPKVIGAIALGAVIRGETTHDEHINRAVTMSLMDLTIQFNRPIGLGLLTCNTVEQAIQRSGGSVGNKGIEAAEAVLEMLRLSRHLSSTS